jgi:hypothetical protein
MIPFMWQSFCGEHAGSHINSTRKGRQIPNKNSGLATLPDIGAANSTRIERQIELAFNCL